MCIVIEQKMMDGVEAEGLQGLKTEAKGIGGSKAQ